MFSLKMYFSVVCVSTLIVLVVGVTAEESENNTEAPVRHRHRHHHRSDAESDEFVAAWKQSPEEGSADGSINSLEARLETLEDDVRHLCMEDEEDIERRIRALGIKCRCPKTEAPVCGSDNVTYYNRCYLQCRAQFAESQYHRYKITLKKFGRC